MTTSILSRATRSGLQKGVSLLELLIAVAIAALLLIGLVQVFSGSRTSYQLTEGVSRNQESGRFALDFLTRDLRMAGHFGCVGDQTRIANRSTDFFTLAFADGTPETVNFAAYNALEWPAQFHVSLQGYEADDTGLEEDFTLEATPAAGGGGWTPALPAAIAGRAIPGSDVVVLRYFSPESITITSIGGGATPVVNFPAAEWPLLAVGAAPRLYGLADCSYATVFAADESTGQLDPVVTAGQVGFRELYQPGQTQLHRAESVAYYVGVSAVSGQPALFRCRGNELSGDCTPEELVEGVENMQLLYGLSDASPSGRLNGNISQVVTAADLGDATASDANREAWLGVGAVQVGLVMRHTAQRSGGDPRTAAFSVLGSGVSPPENDLRVRTAYETSIALRNRLFGN